MYWNNNKCRINSALRFRIVLYDISKFYFWVLVSCLEWKIKTKKSVHFTYTLQFGFLAYSSFFHTVNKTRQMLESIKMVSIPIQKWIALQFCWLLFCFFFFQNCWLRTHNPQDEIMVDIIQWILYSFQSNFLFYQTSIGVSCNNW